MATCIKTVEVLAVPEPPTKSAAVKEGGLFAAGKLSTDSNTNSALFVSRVIRENSRNIP